MEKEITKQDNNKAKTTILRRKYKIVAICILPLLALCLYLNLTTFDWRSLFNALHPKQQSEIIIRREVATALLIHTDKLKAKDFEKVTELDFSDSKLSDIKLLNKCKNLQTLVLTDTDVNNIEPIKELKNLKTLDLRRTDVRNLEPLKGLINLQTLVLADTDVTNIEPIKGLSKLKDLRLDGTAVSNLEPIKGLTNLERLYIENCINITDRQVEDLQKILPELEIHR